MLSESTITARMKLRGFRQAQVEAEGLAAGITEVGVASKAAGAGAATGAGGITKMNSGVKSLRKTAAGLKSAGRTMTTSVTLPMLGIGYMAIKTAATFDKSMAQVGVATNSGGKEMQRMRDYAMEMGAKTIFSANDAAEAMLNLAKAGITPAQIQGGALATTMNLAAAGSMNLADAGNLVGAMMHTFNMKASESVRIADALAGGANSSTADVSDLAQALAQAGQSANMMGLNINETVGTLAAFADQGLRGSDAGTSMKTFLMRLNPVTKKSKELMAELGLNFFDANGEFVGMEKTAQKLQSALGGMTQKQRNAAIQILFGSDAQRAANIVYNAGASGIAKYTKATEKKGSAEKMANAQMKGLPGAIEKLSGSLETAALALGQAIAPAVMTVAGGIEGLANGFTELPGPIQTAIAVGMGIAALAGPVLLFAGALVTAKLRLIELREAEAMGGPGKLMGGRGKMMMAGGALGMGAMVGGNAIGGKLGGWMSNVGMGAAAGSMFGPMGMAVGATAGAVLAAVPAVKELFGAEKKIPPIQEEIARSSKAMNEWFKKSKEAGVSLSGAQNRVKAAHERVKRAGQGVQKAQAAVNRTIRAYGPNSRQAIVAEARLTGQQRKRLGLIHKLRNAEKMHGVALSAYKDVVRSTVLEERHASNVAAKRLKQVSRAYVEEKKRNPQSARTKDLAEQVTHANVRYEGAQKKLNETILEAATKVGPKFANFLRNSNQEVLRAGGLFQNLKLKADGLASALERIAENPVNINPEGLGAGPVFPGVTSTPRPKHKNTSGNGGGTKKPLTRSKVNTGDGNGELLMFRGNGGGGGDTHVTLEVDGKTLAKVVAKHANDDAARE